jgi:peptidylprolyl isomerase/FKBP-type peptidyl-prolyl cis-trans isomerase FkpA
MNKQTIIFLVIILILTAGVVYVIVKPDAVPNPQQTPSNANNTQDMKIETLKEGTGEGAKAGDKVTVNYTGMLENGTKFDSSVDPSFGHVEPFSFTLGQNRVIQGWEQGVLGMKVGEKRKLTIPPELGYGERGAGSTIPPNATLIFEVELLKIN